MMQQMNKKKKQTGKTDDPVRLYLRDMGAVELLSREGEIAIAKRIEAGREKMIGAICESPMTIRSIINWKDAIKDGTMLLRDIVDLEATYDMSDINDSKLEDTLKLIENGSDKKEVKQNNNNEDLNDQDNSENDEQQEDEDDSLNVSLAAMEEKLKPKVLEDFNGITKLFKKLQKHSQDLIFFFVFFVAFDLEFLEEFLTNFFLTNFFLFDFFLIDFFFRFFFLFSTI